MPVFTPVDFLDTPMHVALVLPVLACGLYCIWHGVKAGLIEQRILVDRWEQRYAIGTAAVRRGWGWIALGLVTLVLTLWPL